MSSTKWAGPSTGTPHSVIRETIDHTTGLVLTIPGGTRRIRIIVHGGADCYWRIGSAALVVGDVVTATEHVAGTIDAYGIVANGDVDDTIGRHLDGTTEANLGLRASTDLAPATVSVTFLADMAV